MAAAKIHHIQIGDTPWCEWTGTQAGRDILAKVRPLARMCSHPSGAVAKIAAKALRPHFKRGRVKVVAGRCQHDA